MHIDTITRQNPGSKYGVGIFFATTALEQNLCCYARAASRLGQALSGLNTLANRYIYCVRGQSGTYWPYSTYTLQLLYASHADTSMDRILRYPQDTLLDLSRTGDLCKHCAACTEKQSQELSSRRARTREG